MRDAVASGAAHAFWLAAAGMVLGLLMALALPARRAAVIPAAAG